MDDLEAVRAIVEILEKFDEKEVQERIVRWSLEKTGLQVASSAADDRGGGGGSGGGGGGSGEDGSHFTRAPNAGTDIKSFITKKAPTSDNQFAAAVAYYYAFEAPLSERKAVISASDLTDACRMAGRPRLGDPSKTLRNAQGMGYLDKVAQGTFKLNTVGENLVAITLPSGSGESVPRARKRTPPAKKNRRPVRGKR